MSLAAIFVFFIVSALQLLDRYLDLAKKRGSQSEEQIKLRLEIKQLLKEANQLSTPSTFAQAAKLKRLAVAKEKELAKIQEQDTKGTQSLYDKYGKLLLVTKADNIGHTAEGMHHPPASQAGTGGVSSQRAAGSSPSVKKLQRHHPSATPQSAAEQ